MLNHSATADRAFHALSDGTRRTLVERLTAGPASVSELARPLPMTLAAVVQHLQVLEEAGVVRSEKVGRVRSYQIAPGGLATVEDWVHAQRTAWETRLDRLAEYLNEPDEPRSK
jgi:DNA-binding transcriptional ArsR family regulator